MTDVGLPERLAAAIAVHRSDAGGDPPHRCAWWCADDVRRRAGDVEWTARALAAAWHAHLYNVPLGILPGHPTGWGHECAAECAGDIAGRFASRCGEWRDSRLISFGEHLDNLLAELASHGVRVRRDRLAFACMPALARAGRARPPERLLLDAAGGAEHYDALVAAACQVVEVRGSGWIAGRRYLVLLDHAWGRGAEGRVANCWAERRSTVGVLPAWLYEALGHHRATRRAVRSLAGRIGSRPTWDVPSRPDWGDGGPAMEQGCPTVPAAWG